MTDTPAETTPPTPSCRTASLITSLIGVATLGLCAWMFISGQSEAARWLSMQLPIGGLLVWLAYRTATRHEKQWSLPAAELMRCVDQIRAGRMPIDQLEKTPAPLDALAQSILLMARDLRLQQQQVAMLQAEIQQRVRHRTDSLERSIAALRTQATRDALTGLYNRRMLDEHLPRLIEQCKVEGAALSVMLMDLDHFKLLNDTLGHRAGDEILRALSDLLRSSIRAQDLAFRNGGDEFVVLLPGCREEEAQEIARRINSLTEQLVKPIRVAKKPGLSIGVVSCTNMLAVTPASLLHSADEAMYQTKALRKSRATANVQSVA